MFSKLKEILDRISLISKTIDKFKNDTIIQSLPTLTYVNRAKKFIEKNDFVMAEKILTDALELAQKDALVYKYLGLVYEKTGKASMAVENYQISADLNPNDKNIWQRLGFTLISDKQFDRATKAFENANKIQPLNTDTFTGWGMALMKSEQYQQAYEKFSDAIKVNKYNFSALFLAAVMEIKLNMYDKADSKLAFLTNAAPNEGNFFEYARLKALREDIDNAIFYAKKSLEINSLMLPAYVLLGQLYTKKRDRENALKSFNDAFEKGMGTYDFYYEWGKSLLIFENLEDAKEKLSKANALKPDDIDIQSHLGLCLVLLKEYDEAKLLLDKVSERAPENNALNCALGIICYDNGDWEKTIQYMRNNDEHPINSLFIAKAYEKSGNQIKAKEYYESALQNNKMYYRAYIDYVNYLISVEDYADAQRKLRKALKQDENNITFLNLMFHVSYILVKDDFSEYNVKEALSIANKIEKVNPDLFEYPRQKEELETLLSERDKN